MKARDVMTSPVVTLQPDTPVPAAAALLYSHGFTSAPVLDAAGQIVGIVAEADLVRSPVVPDWWVVQQEPDPTVDQVMTPTPAVMHPEDDLADVVAVMLDSSIRSIPIVDDRDVVGIITRHDVLRVVARRQLIFEEATARRSGGRHSN
jgi:CBS-domain-containing membrane protein